MTSVLTLDNVYLSRDGKQLLSALACHFESGCCTALLGHNGAGKTLLMRTCVGLENTDSGRVQWRDGTTHTFVTQHPIMLHRSVADNVMFPLHGDKGQRREVMKRALIWAGIEHLTKRPAYQLSSGEKQLAAPAWSGFL